ncbi:hypothetical protein AX17_005613 [Amanita inopinata Kibby_2008]|nr:hypothetical protein AX17_005613 [Amanita inopinata Kibby_2008]
MEDSHSFVVDFDYIRGQGFFAVFDGHAGKHAAEWCGSHFHEYLLSCIHASPMTSISNILNESFHKVDKRLSKMCEESDGKIHSGCTAVTAFLRVEDEDGHQSFLGLSKNLLIQQNLRDAKENIINSDSNSAEEQNFDDRRNSASVEKQASLTSSQSHSQVSMPRDSRGEGVSVTIPPANTRRVLYSANAGDARGVLCRAGKAIRLTYDHKGSDKQEAKRIVDSGGFVMSGRVNGVLAVTRSLGDSSMKEFVVGAPYTTQTELCDEDELLILACDGLWDVVGDQNAVELVRDVEDAQEASEMLLKHALTHHTTDNVTVLVVRFKHNA